MTYDSHVEDWDLYRALVALVSRPRRCPIQSAPDPRKESDDRSAGIARCSGAAHTDLRICSRTPRESQ